MSFSSSSRASGLSSMRRRRDLRRDENGYLDDMTDGDVDAGRGFGRSIDKGGDESERRRGRKL
jgi:hypothetical protein